MPGKRGVDVHSGFLVCEAGAGGTEDCSAGVIICG